MSDAVERKIAQLESEKAVAEQLLFLVLDKVDEPVVIDLAYARDRIKDSVMIDMQLDEEAGTWTLQIVEIPNEL